MCAPSGGQTGGGSLRGPETMASGQVQTVSCVVDTDVVIDFLRGRDYVRGLLDHWASRGLLGVSAVTHLEVYHGMREGEEAATNAFLDGLVAVPVDVPVARKAGALLRELRPQGLTIGPADALIAATALTLGVPLLTNNLEHYPFPELNAVPGLVR